MSKLMLIAVGGGIGAVLRYLLTDGIHRLMSVATLPPLPAGTLVVNVLGSVVLGFLAFTLPAVSPLSPAARMAILVGGLGAFTTFSTYAYETVMLLNDGEWAIATLNFFLNNGLALAAAWGGYRLAERMYGVVA